jgi:VWFA-related protein
MKIPLTQCFLFLALALPMAAAGGQTEQSASQQPAATLKVQAREVILPVTVRDKHGALVTNLTAADFTLTEDGRPQAIKSFARESNLPFLSGLLVDTSRSVSGAMDAERKAAEKFLDQMLPADPKTAKAADQAFLIHFDREVELLEDFTSSRDKLDRELEQMGSTAAEQSNRQGPETTGGDTGSGQSGRSSSSRSGTQLYDAIYLASDELMKPKDGRKALILFSDGEDRGSTETLNEALDAAERASVSIFTIYFKGEEERSQSSIPGMGRHGGMGGSYPGGGGWPGSGGSGRRGGGEEKSSVDGRKIMEQIATQTGGRYLEAKKKDNLEEMYKEIAEELRGQYLLTYTPDQVDKDGGYHKVALKAKNSDLTVVTRAGYYAQ